MKSITTICIIILLAINTAKAQKNADSLTVVYANVFTQNKLPFNKKYGVEKPSNELQATFKALFFIYKRFISSQDNARCTFYPSCSVYAMQYVQTKGVIKGVLAGFDRLTRCNGQNREDYQIHHPTQLLYDPVY
ncbi:MAG: membrane protein insertion efficiency factor YidD [Bacteroidetes bacterium]|nr:membrane protein insertion efficiency factor YidD [Bacteroidota bacterium]